MTEKYELLDGEIADIEVLLLGMAPKTLVSHYKKIKKLYKIWFKDLSDDEIETIDKNGKIVKINYKAENVLKRLAGRIEDFDKELRKMFRTKAITDIIVFNHSEVCMFFAKNIAAPNPVKEK